MSHRRELKKSMDNTENIQSPGTPPVALQRACSAACVKCKYWLKKSVASGECRRRAPQVVAYTESNTDGSSGEYRESVDSYTRSEWPTTLAEEWCGEYEPPNEKGQP